MAATALKTKKLGQGHVCHGVASTLLLATVHKHLNTEKTSCWTLEKIIIILLKPNNVSELMFIQLFLFNTTFPAFVAPIF